MDTKHKCGYKNTECGYKNIYEKIIHRKKWRAMTYKKVWIQIKNVDTKIRNVDTKL